MTRTDAAMATVVLVTVCVFGFVLGKHLEKIDYTNRQVTAVAQDLGCTVIEQSYHHPENFYIDCGNDEIRIIKQEK